MPNVQWRSWLLGLALTLGGAFPAHAYLEPMVLIPTHPVDGDTVAFSIVFGSCDSINIPPGTGDSDQYRQVEIVGNVIRVTVPYVRRSPPLCALIPRQERTITIGALPPRQYQLELYGRHPQSSGLPIELLQSTTFQVAGVVRGVPASAPGVIVALMLLVALLGWRGLHRT